MVQPANRDSSATHHRRKAVRNSAPLTLVDPLGNCRIAASEVLGASDQVWRATSGCAQDVVTPPVAKRQILSAERHVSRYADRFVGIRELTDVIQRQNGQTTLVLDAR